MNWYVVGLLIFFALEGVAFWKLWGMVDRSVRDALDRSRSAQTHPQKGAPKRGRPVDIDCQVKENAVSERDGRYSFVDQEVSRERPTIPVPVPEPTEHELVERLERTEQQIALLVGRRERILRKLGRKP